jgi:hypothetical protein
LGIVLFDVVFARCPEELVYTMPVLSIKTDVKTGGVRLNPSVGQLFVGVDELLELTRADSSGLYWR